MSRLAMLAKNARPCKNARFDTLQYLEEYSQKYISTLYTSRKDPSLILFWDETIYRDGSKDNLYGGFLLRQSCLLFDKIFSYATDGFRKQQLMEEANLREK